MPFKIDTKEKFTVITPLDSPDTAKLTASLSTLLSSRLTESNPHTIINLVHLNQVDADFFQLLIKMHERFYQENYSFVICHANASLMSCAPDQETIELLNITPTESEAWDIVQMEEIEREFMNGDDLN